MSSFNGDGIRVSFKGSNTISDNHITSNGGYGIHINAASSNTIAGGFLGGAGIQELSGNTAGGVLIEHVLVKFEVGEAGTGNVLTRNYIGLVPNGNNALANGGDGVWIKTANNRVGDTAATNRNLISGNAGSGVHIEGAAASGNVIERNYIGLAANGMTAIANNGPESAGVVINAAPNNTIGGTSAGARNVISASPYFGVEVYLASGNTIQGNYIGLDATGTFAVPNADGVVIYFSPGTTVGGTISAARNVISGNIADGVLIQGDATVTGVQVQGNFIGTDKNGSSAIGNQGGVISVSVNATIGGTVGTTPGGPCTGACNLISGNGDGLILANQDVGANQVQGNFIGTDVTGNAKLPNLGNGIFIGLYNGATIGGTTAAARNIISGNTGYGIQLQGDIGDASFSSGNFVIGNFIGTNANGSLPLGNGTAGVAMLNPVHDNTVGGTTAGSANLISGNTTGVLISHATQNIVQGNLIGTDISGLNPIPNSGAGIDLTTANANTIGGTSASARNVISGNSIGISISSGAQSNQIQGNFIGTKINGTEALGNSLDGVRIDDSTNNVIGVAVNPSTGVVTGTGNVISGNLQNGIDLERISSGANANVVAGNFVGIDITGTKKVPNAFNGILINTSSGNTIGGTQAALRNVISGNGGSGVNVIGDPATKTADANMIQGNYLGTNLTGQAALGNGGRGIDLSGATTTTVGGSSPGARNIISGNAMQGITLHNEATGNVVQGNLIGTDVNGSTALGNGGDGIFIENAPANNVGGSSAAFRNVISANNGAGIHFLDTAAHDNFVQGNFIGADVNGTKDLGNLGDGIQIKNAAKNIIGGTTTGAGNLIAFNKANGINIFESMANTANGDSVLGNSIFGNAKLGIDLADEGVTANDPDDNDAGPNLLQNFPLITAAAFSGTQLNVSGSLASGPSTTYRIELFGNSSSDPSGFGEGQFYLGFLSLTTDGNGNASFSSSVVASAGYQKIAATATDPGGNTSELSASVDISGPPPSPTPTPTATPGVVVNVSTRLPVGTDDNVLIEGFIVQGPAGSTKKIIVRAIGPSLLPFGISDALANPTLDIFDANNFKIASNNDWKITQAGGIIAGDQSAEIAASGVAPGNDLESAIIANLLPGSYTAVVRGLGNTVGTGVVDAYDLSNASAAKLANTATRGLIQPGDKLMIAGFIIENGPVRAVVRAIGPSLSAFGINNALPDTTLQLRDQNGAIVRENDDWMSDQQAELEASGLQPSNNLEAALIETIPPGQYTAQVRGKPETTGIGVVEIYFLP
jgi:parallel beta-helix repeat protein